MINRDTLLCMSLAGRPATSAPAFITICMKSWG
jgi:hypothetical protein